jgi:hypothetical protein
MEVLISQEVSRSIGKQVEEIRNRLKGQSSRHPIKKEHLELVSQEPMINKGTVYVKVF